MVKRAIPKAERPLHGYPRAIRVDNRSEFVSRDRDLWTYQRVVTLDFLRRGKRTDEAFIEAFNRKLRSECVNTHCVLPLDDACEKLDHWRGHCNEERPHGAIGNTTSPPDPSQAEDSRPQRSTRLMRTYAISFNVLPSKKCSLARTYRQGDLSKSTHFRNPQKIVVMFQGIVRFTASFRFAEKTFESDAKVG